MCRGSGWYGINHSYVDQYRISQHVTYTSCFLCPFITQLSSETWYFMCSLILLQVWHWRHPSIQLRIILRESDYMGQIYQNEPRTQLADSIRKVSMDGDLNQRKCVLFVQNLCPLLSSSTCIRGRHCIVQLRTKAQVRWLLTSTRINTLRVWARFSMFSSTKICVFVCG